MRILHLTATYAPSVNGVAGSVQLLSQTQRRMGHQVLVYAPHHPRATKSSAFTLRYPALLTPFSPDYPLGSPLFIPPQIKRFAPQIIHTHHPFHYGYLALHLGHHFNAKVFLTHHTQYQAYLKTYFKYSSVFNRLIDLHLIHLYRHLNGVICPTLTLQHWLTGHGISQAVYIPNGIDLENFTPNPQPTPTPHLIYVGRLDKEKQPQLLLDLAESLSARLANYRFTLVGGGSLLKALSRQVTLRRLDSYVTFTGMLNRSQLPPILHRHQLFVSYSQSEIMPLSYIEALACGLPVGVTRPGHISRLLNPRNSLILSETPGQAASQIIRLFQNPGRLKAMSASASHSAQRFSINTTANQIIKMYDKPINYL